VKRKERKVSFKKECESCGRVEWRNFVASCSIITNFFITHTYARINYYHHPCNQKVRKSYRQKQYKVSLRKWQHKFMTQLLDFNYLYVHKNSPNNKQQQPCVWWGTHKLHIMRNTAYLCLVVYMNCIRVWCNFIGPICYISLRSFPTKLPLRISFCWFCRCYQGFCHFIFMKNVLLRFSLSPSTLLIIYLITTHYYTSEIASDQFSSRPTIYLFSRLPNCLYLFNFERVNPVIATNINSITTTIISEIGRKEESLSSNHCNSMLHTWKQKQYFVMHWKWQIIKFNISFHTCHLLPAW
jgi:hypothetical protein